MLHCQATTTIPSQTCANNVPLSYSPCLTFVRIPLDLIIFTTPSLVSTVSFCPSSVVYPSGNTNRYRREVPMKATHVINRCCCVFSFWVLASSARNCD
jgi:hypothetical protein